MPEPHLSAVIIAKNEEARISRCLESLRWIEDIVVVDDDSTDRTREICERAGARVVMRRSDGDFDEQRNAGIDAARGEWIFQLDADEVVPSALRDELLRVLEASGDTVAYRLSRLNHFLGRAMHHGDWAGTGGVKLFKKSAGRYVGHSVHETLAVQGQIADLEHRIEHYPFQNLTQLVARSNFYSDVEARQLREEQPHMRGRALRYQLAVRPVKLFWKSYVKRSGWRDGMHGFVFTVLSAWVRFLTWAKYWAWGLPQPAGVSGPKEEAGRATSLPVAPAVDVVPERATVSVVVPTKNEERTIARCLQSVAWADERVVVDGCSTDRTVEICRALGAKVIIHPFDGSFSTDRNIGMEQAQGDWVLQIDADDVATPEFRQRVETLLRSKPEHAAFKFRRRSVMLGRVMRYGGWYYSVPNLVRRDRVRYEGLVHERPKVEGTIGELDADVEHHPCEDLTIFVARQNRYTSLQAHELLRTLGVLPRRELVRRMRKRPWKTFWKSYVKKAGYREGLHGLVFAIFFAGVEFMKWAKYWELLEVAGGGAARVQGPADPAVLVEPLTQAVSHDG